MHDEKFSEAIAKALSGLDQLADGIASFQNPEADKLRDEIKTVRNSITDAWIDHGSGKEKECTAILNEAFTRTLEITMDIGKLVIRYGG